MHALLLAVWLGPSPASTDESVIYEPPPPARDVLEPIEITPPPEREPIVVEPAPQLVEPPPPAPAPIPLPPPPPPPSGNGQFVGAGFSIGLGLAALSVVAIEGTRAEPQQEAVAATFVPLSVGGIAIGTYLLIRGIKARKRFMDWRTYTGADVRPNGDGLLVAGIMSTVIGGVTLVAGAVQAREPNAGAAVPITFAVGATALVAGIGTLTWGLMRRSRYRSWRQSTFLSVSPPVIVPLRAGIGVGGSLRF